MKKSRRIGVTATADLLVVALAAFLFLTERRETVPIPHVVQVDETSLQLDGRCLGESQVEVREDVEEVRLRHTALRHVIGPQPLCLVQVQVELAEPLGSRLAVDDTTERVLPVREQNND